MNVKSNNANVHTKKGKGKTTFRGTWHNSGHATEVPTEMPRRNKVESFLQVVETRDHISPSPARYLPKQIEVSKFPVIKPSFRQRPLDLNIVIIIGLVYVVDICLFLLSNVFEHLWLQKKTIIPPHH